MELSRIGNWGNFVFIVELVFTTFTPSFSASVNAIRRVALQILHVED